MDSNKKIIQRTYHSHSPLTIKRDDNADPMTGESRIITGYAIVFDLATVPMYEDEESTVLEMIAPEAVTKELLDTQDIKMTLFHDNEQLLARSNKGEGTLSYTVDSKGVRFEFEAPRTVDGDKALELVRRGDISGCSFAFSTYYYDPEYVMHDVQDVEGRKTELYRVLKILGVYDFTLTTDPAYPDTSVEAREIARGRQRIQTDPATGGAMSETAKRQIDEMRQTATKGLKL